MVQILVNILYFFVFISGLNNSNSDKIVEPTNRDLKYDLRKSLPSNYVKDGSVDYTSYIQQAISLNDQIVFPGFPILINDNGLRIGSNKKIYFEKGSEIRLKPSSKKIYNILHLRNVKNVELINPVIKGDRNSHIGKVGEWGMGIGIYSSDNIKIVNPRISNCWGDGIYLGKSNGGTNNNIQISNAYCINNRRDAISIITVSGLLLESPYAGHSNGIAPMAGINVEPNDPTDLVQNIKIINPKTEYNKGAGISIGLSKLYGKADKKVTIEIINHVDLKSNIGLKSSCYPKRKSGNEEVRGSINISNPVWIKNSKVPLQTALFQKDLKISIFKPTIVDMNNKSLPKEAMRKMLTSKGNINSHANYYVSYKEDK
ncbi:hypothetical protein [Daejeonella oryzae]|uniref:hypothetical protein n=1 Tax=Daejeonella oryzae TaxID=1122943 RepID=UPI00041968F2|nr:hypothetical protein [Daejeonella oryzae]